MASSIRLKACGGLAPYIWSFTGNVTISDTSGTAITVSTSGTGVNNYPGVTAYTSVAFWLVNFTDNGDCGGGGRYSLTTWAGAPVSRYDCQQNLLGVEGDSFLTAPAQQRIQGTGTICGAALDITQDAGLAGNNNLTLGSPDGASGTVQVTMTLTAQNSEATNYSEVESSGITADPGTIMTFPGLMDFRTQAMVDGGCSPCDDPSGATITVTDAAGVSVTTVL